MYRDHLKRLIDLVVAVFFILITFPVSLTTWVMLAFTNVGEPFFFQKRPCKNEYIFTIIKFKTMNDRKDAEGNLLPDYHRLTNVGAFVRKISLDELPQLINVLKGDMSLIGPRPLLVEYLPIYDEQQKRRHKVRPGITGWAQVNGRNAISWKQKFEYDVWYVDNCSFALDMKILWMTVQKVFKRDGISQVGQATVEKFNGHN